MPFRTSGELCYYLFDSLESGVIHAVFARRGGVSPEPWASLNMGGSVGDEKSRVLENRRRAVSALGLSSSSVYDVWQVHGNEVAIADAPRPPETPYRQADIILTDKPGVILLMRFADCVPILLHDPVRKVVGLAHAGWLGTVKGTVRVAVEAMQNRYHSDPGDILAAIGPSIGPDHYEVGPDVVIQVQQAFRESPEKFLTVLDGHMFFNLWEANRKHLELAGVRTTEIAGLCTACHTDDWFSHRAEKGRTGRFGAVIALA